MRIASLIVLVCAGLMVFQGCDKKPANNSEAMARVNAAVQIGNPSDRDDALASACRGAAKIGALDAVLRGLPKIGNPSTRDEVASDCASALRDCGQRQGATEVAKSIGNPSQRDSVLKNLAGS